MPNRYRVLTPTVVHESFDQEVVIVNLDSGDYYSLSGSGSDCWHCILAGMTIEETAAAVAQRYSGDEAGISAAVSNLFDALQEAKLIQSDPSIQTASPSALPNGNHQGDFAAPSLSAYSDMRDLLLIDPIHEVDDTGWPEARKDENGQNH